MHSIRPLLLYRWLSLEQMGKSLITARSRPRALFTEFSVFGICKLSQNEFGPLAESMSNGHFWCVYTILWPSRCSRMNSIIHSFIHSSIHSFIHSFIHSVIRLFIQTRTWKLDPFIHQFMISLVSCHLKAHDLQVLVSSTLSILFNLSPHFVVYKSVEASGKMREKGKKREKKKPCGRQEDPEELEKQEDPYKTERKTQKTGRNGWRQKKKRSRFGLLHFSRARLI